MLEEFMPAILTILGTIVTAVLGLFVDVARRKWNVDIDQRAQDSLHRAITSILHKLLADGHNIGDISHSPTMRNTVRKYVERSVSGSVRRLSPLPDVLDDLIIGKANEVLRGQTGGK